MKMCGVLFRTLATKAPVNTPISWGPRRHDAVSSLTQEATTSPRVVNVPGKPDTLLGQILATPREEIQNDVRIPQF